MTIHPRRRLDREARKDAILVAATSVFREHGYTAATMETIAERSEVNIATVYYYFASKEILYLAVLLRAIRVLRPQLDAAAVDGRSARERLSALAYAYCSFFRAHPESQVVVHCLQTKSVDPADEESRALVERARVETRHAMGVVARVIADGIESGELRAVSARDATALFWASLNGVLQMAENKGVFREESDHELLTDWLDLMFCGLAAPAVASVTPASADATL